MELQHREPEPSLEELSPEEFQLLYGPWQPLLPAELLKLFEDAPFKWWIAGGQALTAAGVTDRPHEDLDVAVLARDLVEVRQWLAGYHVWEASRGGLRPLRPNETLTDGCEQLWVRRNALSPWVMDVLLTPTDGDEWLFKRNHAVRRPLSEIGRLGADGVPYLSPEIVLLFKASLLRQKDEADFAAVIPSFDAATRQWLATALAVAHPGHHWEAQLT
ncbi:MAG: hypothetical protein ABI334_07560 [Candidatus Dormiibacterota bacterium]